MALKYRNGHYYAYTSTRHGKRVESRYLASGPMALLCVEQQREATEERRAIRAAIRHARAVKAEGCRSARIEAREHCIRLGSIGSAVAAYHRRIGRLAEALIRALGYHKHARGQWRRRRMNAPATIQPDLTELARLVDAGDVRTLEAMFYKIDCAFYRCAEDGTLNRGGIEEILLQSLGQWAGRVEKEAMLADARRIRFDLAPMGSNPAEALMAERASVSWLEVRLLEIDRADLIQQENPDRRKLETADRMLSRASARLERALIGLAKLRRLKLPIVINQVNVVRSGQRRPDCRGVSVPRPPRNRPRQGRTIKGRADRGSPNVRQIRFLRINKL